MSPNSLKKISGFCFRKKSWTATNRPFRRLKLNFRQKMFFCLSEKNLWKSFSSHKIRVPTRTGRKPGKMGKHFPVREKSGNFDQTGKVRENHTKYWKTEGISDKYYMLFFSWQLNKFVYYWLNLIKFLVKKRITGKKNWKKWEKILEFCQSGKVGTMKMLPLFVAGCSVAKTELYLRYSQLFHITHNSVGMSLVSHSPPSLERIHVCANDPHS